MTAAVTKPIPYSTQLKAAASAAVSIFTPSAKWKSRDKVAALGERVELAGCMVRQLVSEPAQACDGSFRGPT
jgi:hypothetical protein